MTRQRTAIVAVASAVAGAMLAKLLDFLTRRWNRRRPFVDPPWIGLNGAEDLIGNTPMILLPTLSKELGCTILAKCEFMNPGGSSKDRVALSILSSAESGKIGTVYEGTVGSTGIALAWLSRSKGIKCHIVIPDDQAKEKYQLLDALGACVEMVKPASIVDPGQFCRLAERRASNDPKGLFANQFENLDNFRAHYERTGPEIWSQVMRSFSRMDYLVMGAGTGGTLAGCSRYIKEQDSDVCVVLADPPGSGIYHKVRHDIFYAHQESEGTRRRNQVDSVVEGVGINRMTRNLDMVLGTGKYFKNTLTALAAVESLRKVTRFDEKIRWIDDSFQVSDKEAACMARYMVDKEGLFMGSSSCVNLVACVKLARKIRNEHQQPPVIVTILCDAGYRHLTKFWSDSYLEHNGIVSAKELSAVQSLDFVE